MENPQLFIASLVKWVGIVWFLFLVFMFLAVSGISDSKPNMDFFSFFNPLTIASLVGAIILFTLGTAWMKRIKQGATKK